MELFSQLELNEYQRRTLAILEKSESILLKYGYSKSTIDEIAYAAKLGKGTIYLHWRSKDDLFQALFYKISAEIVNQLLLAVQTDISILQFDKFISTIYRICHEKELIVALFTRDNKLLGRFLDYRGSSESQMMKLNSLKNSLHMYRQNKLIKDNLSIEAQAHAINMLLIAIFTYDNYITEEMSIDQKVEILENIVRSTFVPETPREIEASLYEFVILSIKELLNFYMQQVLFTKVK